MIEVEDLTSSKPRSKQDELVPYFLEFIDDLREEGFEMKHVAGAFVNFSFFTAVMACETELGFNKYETIERVQQSQNRAFAGWTKALKKHGDIAIAFRETYGPDVWDKAIDSLRGAEEEDGG